MSLLVVLLLAGEGCGWSKRRAVWFGSGYAPVQSGVAGASVARQVVLRPADGEAVATPPHASGRATINKQAALKGAEGSFRQGRIAEQAGRQECVEWYYRAARAGWTYLAACESPSSTDSDYLQAWRVYHTSVARWIATGQRFKRWDPRHGMLTRSAGKARWVPVAHHGFPWKPDDFGRLEVFGGYQSRELSHVYRSEGLGVPLVALRTEPCRCDVACRLVRRRQPFAATAVLRFDNPACAGGAVLDLFDPLRSGVIQTDSFQAPVARDLTAPLAYSLHKAGRDYLIGFLDPSNTETEARLYMIEPYQPGKIPIIFVHGLLSDPSTWFDLANELRARPELSNRYQIWAFEYSTGRSFFASAAKMRAEICKIVADLDPEGRDPALRDMVLVGHSMGGLVCKLQVTSSGTTLWNAAANRPLDQIRADPKQRAQLQRTFFFEPVPYVRRVVFIATPHRGSYLAQRPAALVSSAMIEFPPELRESHRKLIEANPGVFSEELQKRPPTSIMVLDPDSPLLKAMLRLDVAPGVQLHSIIGDGDWTIRDGPSDGIVAVSSAVHPCVVSQRFVPTDHGEVHHHPDTIEEMVNILRRHVAEYDQQRNATVAE